MLSANLNQKQQLRHRAVSLRQHGFLVLQGVSTACCAAPPVFAMVKLSVRPGPEIVGPYSQFCNNADFNRNEQGDLP